MRLFTAVWPDAVANADVDARLRAADVGDPWRPTAPERRHVTLRFHGGGDPTDRDALAERLRAADPPAGLRLRVRGAGVFGTAPGSSALWLGVEPDDPARLDALVVAAGGDPREHVAHLTIARSRRRRPVPPTLPTGPGPWWPVTAVDLVASGTPYRRVARVEPA